MAICITPLFTFSSFAEDAKKADILYEYYKDGCNSFKKLSDDILNQENTTRLHLASACHNSKYFDETLKQNTKNINAKDKKSRTPLHVAILTQNQKHIQSLIQAGADINAIDKVGATPLHYAVMSNDPTTIKMLIEKGVPINASAIENITPLHLAAQTNHLNALVALLKAGADVHAKSIDGMTALHFSVSANNVIDNENQHFYSSINILNSMFNNIELMDALIKAGADVNSRNIDGSSPLHMAVLSSNGLAVTDLLLAGADVDATENKLDLTPLMLTALIPDQSLSDTMAKILIQGNANVNASNKQGDTTLHFTSAFGNLKLLNLLLENQANIYATNQDGDTPIDVATKAGQKNIIKALKAHADKGSK